VDVGVGIDSRPDGSGRVTATMTLDADASAQVPDLAGQLRVDDLRQAGWQIDGPTDVSGGGRVVTARKDFPDPSGAAVAMGQLSGQSGPFRQFRLTHRRTFLKTTTTFEGTVDLTSGIEGFSDGELRARLGGSPLGVDVAGLEQRLGIAFDRVFIFQVSARLPGDATSNAPPEVGGRAVWKPKLGEQVVLQAEAVRWNTRQIVGAMVAVLAGLALASALVARVIRRSGGYLDEPPTEQGAGVADGG
jgi:hypothetical protein